MTIHRRLEERLAAFKRRRGRAAVRLGLPRQHRRRSRALARPRRGRLLRRAQPRLDRRRLPAGARRDVRLPPRRRRAPRVGPAPGRGPRRADRHRRASSRWTATSRRSTEIVELARRYDVRVVVDEAHGTGCARARAGAARSPRPALEGEVDVVVGTLGKALGSYGAFVACDQAMAQLPRQHARARSSSRPRRRRPRSPARWPRSSCSREQPRRVEQAAGQRRRAARRARPRGLRGRGLDDADRAAVVGDAEQAMRICELALERGVFAQAIRPPTVPEGTSRLRLAVMASHTQGRAARGRAGARARGAAGRLAPGRGRARRGRARGRRGRASDGAVRHRAPGRVGALARARPLRHRHRHRRRQDRRSPRRWPRRCAPTACASPRSSRSSRASTSPTRDRPARPRAARRGGRATPADEVTPHRFGPAVSPHLAAELAGTALDPAALVAARARRCAPTSSSPRASAGCSSRSRSATRSATSRVDLGLPVVVAARPGLGTINHTLLTLEAARAARPRRARGRAHAVAGAAERDGALQRARRSRASARVEVATLGEVGVEVAQLARAGATLPYARWL